MERIRERYLKDIALDFEIVPICALLGPRQCGKTTLARQFAKIYQGPVHYFDLEDYTDLSRLTNPKLALDHLEGLIIIDEVQRKPELFSYLRVLADRPNTKIKFLILGSASRDLLQQSSETLAGRLSYIAVSPFLLEEVGNQQVLWNRGGFPKSFLADSDISSARWRQIYMQTYFEKDLAYLGLKLPPQRILKLWAMLAQYQACTINYAHMAQFMEISVPTLKNYLGLLEGTFMIRILAPWYENLGKRLVKTPKLYVRDSGIYHQLLNIQTYEQLILNTHVGFSWESFALEETAKALNLRNEECYFWATHQEAELDLFVILNGKRLGFEFKIHDKPGITKSMRIALDSLNLEHLYIVTPHEKSFPLENRVSVLALKDAAKLSKPNYWQD
jgi:predicted AAA+ superfamily ATPase